MLSSDGARAVTGADGTFVLRALKPGPAQVTVRRVGYTPVVRDVDLVNGSASSLTVLLMASPVQLAETHCRCRTSERWGHVDRSRRHRAERSQRPGRYPAATGWRGGDAGRRTGLTRHGIDSWIERQPGAGAGRRRAAEPGGERQCRSLAGTARQRGEDLGGARRPVGALRPAGAGGCDRGGDPPPGRGRGAGRDGSRHLRRPQPGGPGKRGTQHGRGCRRVGERRVQRLRRRLPVRDSARTRGRHRCPPQLRSARRLAQRLADVDRCHRRGAGAG